MSTVPVPAPHVRYVERQLPTWFQSRVLWAGLAIVTMWLAVLFVGIFGGDIVSGAAATGGVAGDTVPAGVAVALFAFLATPFVARWGFAARRMELDQLQAALTEEVVAREELAAEIADLRRRVVE